MTLDYLPQEPLRDEVDALPGSTLLEFGSPWCGHCRIAQPLVEAALAAHPELRHLKIHDASGRRLGRSFQVRLWPTLVFLRNGEEIARVIRPREPAAIDQALRQLSAS
jgi:thioredoxin 1